MTGARIGSAQFRETKLFCRNVIEKTMPTTRSAGKQAKLDDFKEGDSLKPQPGRRHFQSESNAPDKKTTTSSKRKSSSDTKSSTAPVPSKKPKAATKDAKQAQLTADNISELESPIIINRSPVLQLWGAVVARFLHQDESWAACLSMGGAIASLCAMTKGKSVGAIEPKDRSEEEEKQQRERKEKAKENARDVEVMGFPLHIKGDAAILSGKPHPLKEGSIIGKFGGEEPYNRTKKTMEDALHSWEGDEDALNKKAFHMYEKFRPNVAKGMAGWGRKGELNLHEVNSTIKR